MRPAATARETFAATIAFETAGCAVHLRLRSCDEGGQAIDASVGDNRLRLGLRLILRLRTVLTLPVFARLLVALVGLPLALLIALIEVALIVIALIVFARHERLRLCRNEARLLAEMREALALVLAFIGGRHFIVGARLRLVLPELLLGGSDQTEIMFGVLIVVLGRNRIARTLRVSRELDIFFRYMRSGAANFDVGTV